jgi:hypothetical protein
MVLFSYTAMKNQYNIQFRFGLQKRSVPKLRKINNEIEMK